MLTQLALTTVENYFVDDETVCREIIRRDGTTVLTSMRRPDSSETDWGDDALFDLGWLRSDRAPRSPSGKNAVRVVDLFAGTGGLTLGVSEACRALGREMESVLAVDIDGDALRSYGHNFPTAELWTRPVDEVLQPFGTQAVSSDEAELVALVGDVDLLIGGPPCQGHSDLNNHTRRSDPKNELYTTMARFCELVRPANVILENVPGVVRDATQVAQRTWSYLRKLGYTVDSAVMDASAVGVAQQRRRSITLASVEVVPSVAEAESDASVPIRPLAWAISDLSVDPENAPYDTAPQPSDENSRRMEYLFENRLFDLPDSQRPDCHRLKAHSYVSMYGRLHWDLPAPTITTGFGSPGRGRWIHPDEQRTITPHEAARIQGFPDWFEFPSANRTLLHKMIGNAVPPKLGYAAGLHLLR